MTAFIPGGPARFTHQKAGLRRMIETGGTTALLWDPGCIYGDADMVINRAGKTFHLSLRDLVSRFNGERPRANGQVNGRAWDPKIPTRVQHEAADGTIRLIEITSAWSSGIKQTYTVTTDSGRSIRATDEHPFLTDGGWKRLDELCPGTRVHVYGQQKDRGRCIKQRYRERGGLRLHPHAYKRDASRNPHRVAEHRLVIEAQMNGMTLEQWLAALRGESLNLGSVAFLSADQVVHHRDGNPINNDPANLQVMTVDEHHRHHADDGKTCHVLFKTALDVVVSVVPYGREETFDIEVNGEPHNFLANGFVVHNTGKTAATIDFLSVLTLSRARRPVDPEGETRVLVVCPLAAVDTWVTQMETYASPQVGFWAEALGGTIIQRAEALASRGGRPYSPRTARQTAAKAPRTRSNVSKGRRPTPTPRAPQRDAHVAKSRIITGRSPLIPTLAHPEFVNPEFIGSESVNTRLGPDAVLGPRLVVEVVNLDTFSSRAQIGSRTAADVLVDAVDRFSPEVVVVDEAHRIKSASSNVSRLLARIGKRVPRRIILTGTVMPHSPMDVFGQWRFLDPEAFSTLLRDGTRHPMSYGAFEERYATLGGWMGRQAVGFQRLDEMQAVMSQRASVVRKADALDLPVTTDVVIPVNLDATEKKAYDEMKKNLVAQIGTATVIAPNRLTQMLRLRQITSGASKVKTIKSLVHDTLGGERRIVVFALFRDEIRELEAALATKGTEIMTITGDTCPTDRLAYRRRFGSENPGRIVMIAQIRTMSLAVNELVTASHAVFATLPQQRDDLVQARDRLHRIGQTLPVTFWYAVAPNTVDEVVMTSHRHRTNLEREMLRHVRGDQ